MAVLAAFSFFFLLFGHCKAKYPLAPQYKHKLLSNQCFFWVSVRGVCFLEVVLSVRERFIGPDAVPDTVLAGEG